MRRRGVALVTLALWPALLSATSNTLSPKVGCDLHQGACRASAAGGGAITLRIDPLRIPVLDELQLEVRLEGIEASDIEVQFSGINVDMGLLRYNLEPAGRGVFRGPAWLSVCSARRMIWQALVVVDGGRYEAPFQFDTEYRREFSLIE